MELADERHGDAVEAIAVAEVVDETVLGAQELGAAAETGDDAGDHEAHEDVALDGEAVELRGRHVETHRPELEALGGVEQEIVDEKSHHHGDDEGRGEPEAEEPGELGLLH